MTALLSDMASRLVAKTDRPDESYAVQILDSPVVNAFALPSGRLFLTRGLLALASDSAEVAAVMAHEIAHVTRQHATARGELEARSALVTRVVADVLEDQAGAAQFRDRSRATLASFSRAQEFEADSVGIQTVGAAGYDPGGAARFLSTLDRNALSGLPDPQRNVARGETMFATHPATGERIALARAAARPWGETGDRGRDGYLDALDAIAYGDNPEDGQVRGRRFLHPRLGVAFEAPDGFSLENTPRAVLGATPDGRNRLLFDALEATDGQDLGAVLSSSWTPPLDLDGGPEGAGRQVATARSRDDGWIFRLAAARIGGTVFRLVMAEREPAGSLDRDFDRTLATLRALGREEAGAIKPRRLAIVAAKAGDRPETLASRMATDRPLERFLLLNGLDRGAALRPGERYKIVVDRDGPAFKEMEP